MGRKVNSKAALITRCALFAAVTALLSQVAFPVGPFPFSMGLFGVMLCGGLLSPAEAFLSQLAYVALGGVGLPVFSGFQGGLQYLVGPTGGFLFAYPFVALIISLFCRGKWVKRLFGYGISLCVCYGTGAIWYGVVSGAGFFAALGVTVLPFIIPDVIKAALSAFLSVGVRKRISL